MPVLEQLTVVTLSGLYTSLWGAFKDSPYEGLKWLTFSRSVWLSWLIWAGLAYVLPSLPGFQTLNEVQLFFFVMGLERLLTELYKGFLRVEDQSKYRIPSRVSFFGKPVTREWVRMPLGLLLGSMTLVASYLPTEISGFVGFMIVSCLSGLFVSIGGAYKDAPFEGFAALKFQRSVIVLAIAGPYFWRYGSVPLGILAFMDGGLERFLVEYYKTYIGRNIAGKFRSDLEQHSCQRVSREKFQIAAWAIMLLVIWKSI